MPTCCNFYFRPTEYKPFFIYQDVMRAERETARCKHLIFSNQFLARQSRLLCKYKRRFCPQCTVFNKTFFLVHRALSWLFRTYGVLLSPWRRTIWWQLHSLSACQLVGSGYITVAAVSSRSKHWHWRIHLGTGQSRTPCRRRRRRPERSGHLRSDRSKVLQSLPVSQQSKGKLYFWICGGMD